jgi:lipoate-protein ligase A
MAIDEAISICVREGKSLPTFRLYGWNLESVSLGEFQKIEEIDLDFCNQNNIPVVRRPTAGKGILHYNDITYSFSSKKEGVFKGNLSKTYEVISNIFLKAFRLSGLEVENKKRDKLINRSPVCFARTSFAEICYKGFKILGSAQKRWINGFLQQGTIPLIVNRELLKKIFINSNEEIDKIFGLYELFEYFNMEKFIENIKITLKDFGFLILEASLLDEEIELAEKLLQKKYNNPQWLLGKSFPYVNSKQKK